ncbi:MAG: response regulator, partial [Victivallales bacterium]
RLDDESMRKDAENILRISRRSSDLTKEMLAFARKGKYQAVPVNIHKLIEEVISLLSHSLDKRIEIKRVLKASPATIMGDPTQLQSSLLNLAINARDAMPKGGELAFTTETLEMDSSCFSNVKKLVSNRYLKICVIDSGMGMDSETIKHIFEPFFTTKEPGKGTGMGLASVYGTVNTHNGLINVESEIGKGSVFSIFFPLYEEELEYEVSSPAPVDARKEANILLVDDEEIVRDMVARMLRSFGHKVMTCRDGLEALEYYKQSWNKIDLVVLDMMMPRMNGGDSFIGMRTVNPEIRAVLMSGYSIDEEVQGLLDAGMKGFIQKPFNTRELNKIVGSALKSG